MGEVLYVSFEEMGKYDRAALVVMRKNSDGSFTVLKEALGEQAEALYKILTNQEKKTGHWLKHDTGHSIYYDCSLCGCSAPCTETADSFVWKLSNYCPDCGTKMVEQPESESKRYTVLAKSYLQGLRKGLAESGKNR